MVGWLTAQGSDFRDILAARRLDLRVLGRAPAGGVNFPRAASGLHALCLGVPFVLPRPGQSEAGGRNPTRGTGRGFIGYDSVVWAGHQPTDQH